MPDDYVPAAGRAAFTGLYDRAMALTMRERAWRPAFTEGIVAGLPAGGTVVDVGCGTATQAIAIARRREDATVIGFDGDPEVLALAARKPGADAVDLRSGLAGRIDLPDGSADRVLISLVLHHLRPDAKLAALTEARRLLRAGGELHVVDWGRPRDPVMRSAFFALQLLDGMPNTRDHASGRWLEAFTAAGFDAPRTDQRLRTPWGLLERVVASAAIRPTPGTNRPTRPA